MTDKLYMFNPFVIKKATEQDLSDTYQTIMSELIDDPQTPFQYSHNIEVYANLNYLIGEMIARRERERINLKTQIEINKSIYSTEQRKNWSEDKGRVPAMSYFEALGTQYCQEDIKRLADLESSYRRFKNAYTSIEEKINALKKAQDSIKYEESL